jgi:flagellar biogenesis protein FliO
MNITAVAIVAIVCWAIVELVNSRNKKTPKAQDLNALQQELSGLKDRVQTLEKIVIDENYNLKKQFEDLKD